MANSVTLIDLLIVGDDRVARHVPREMGFADELDDRERSTEELVTLWCCYLSHFVADACMPCHCDARPLSSYSKGKLHKYLEMHWNDLVGEEFEKDHLADDGLSAADYLAAARAVDGRVGIAFRGKIPDIPRYRDRSSGRRKKKDIWHDLVDVCRASFTVASIIAPPEAYPYGGRAHPPFDELFSGPDGEELLTDLDRAVLHDAVLNTAMVWKDVWRRF